MKGLLGACLAASHCNRSNPGERTSEIHANLSKERIGTRLRCSDGDQSYPDEPSNNRESFPWWSDTSIRNRLKLGRQVACIQPSMKQCSLDDYPRIIKEESRRLGDQARNARRLAEELCAHSWQLHVRSEAIHRKVNRILHEQRGYLEEVGG